MPHYTAEQLRAYGDARAAHARRSELDVGIRTGYPPGMLQDDDRKLSKALASKPDAMRNAREAVADIRAATLAAPTAPATAWKAGNEFLPYHPSASHVPPDYRDGWNHCYATAQQARQAGCEISDEQIAAIAKSMPGGLDGFLKGWGWQQFARKILELRAPPAWEPQFDVISPKQEELVLEFCAEIAGPKGKPGRPPDPVRLLEMAQALYEAERKECGP